MENNLVAAITDCFGCPFFVEIARDIFECRCGIDTCGLAVQAAAAALVAECRAALADADAFEAEASERGYRLR